MRKKGISLILSVLLILVMLPPASVLADTEFEIASYADLCTFRDRVNAGELELKAKLTEDIVCENADGTPAVDWTPIGEAFYPYEGTFDGQGHTITGLSNSGVDYSGSTAGVFYVGLFGFINGCGTVKNVVIEDCDLSFSPGAQGMHIYIGAVAAENHGTIENCRNTGTVTATLDDAYVGGIVGFSDGTLKNCNNTGAVSGSGVNVEIGGVAGSSYRPVENCYNLGTVSCIGNDSKIGGVVGYCYKQATGCYNSGEVSGSGENNYIGGVVGCNFDTIENCYNSGEVSGSGEDAYTGGVIGCGFGTAGYCYNSGEVFGSGEDASTGGVVGYSFYPVDNCYNTGEVSGSGEDACIGGVFGNASGDVNCCYNTGKVSGSGEYACIGGVAGCNSDPIGNCYNSGEVSGSSESTYVGGIVGSSHYPVNNCYNAGAVSVEAWSHVGGIVGGASKVVSRCLNVGPVSGGESSDVGGIAGVVNSLGSLENCLNAGAVSGYNCSFTGGIVGYNIYGKVQKCLNVGAIASNNYNDAGGVVGTMPNHQTETSYVEYCYCSNTIAPVGSVGSGTVTSVKALTADELKTLANCVGFEAENWAEGPEFPLLKGFVYLFYDANGGEGSMMMTPGLFGWGLTAAENTFSNASYLAFAGWNTKADGKGDNVDAGSSVTLAANELYRTLYAQWKKLTYTIKFVNDDGTVLQSGLIEYGETPAYTGETPTKASTAQYTYTFAGWTPEIAAVTGDATYTATYSKTVNKYTIKFVNDDGTVLQSSEVEYGETPSYTGETPTKAATAQYTYTFAGWTPEIAAVTGDATYTATYSKTVNKYTVKFVNEDGTVLQSSEVEYGETPAYTGETPTKASTAQYTYTFAGWTPEIAAVTGDATYTATYSKTVNKYTIKFVNDDGTVLQSGLVEYGETPAYTGETPTKASTAQYTYTFAGWTPEIAAVTGDATYTATYSKTVNKYTVKFVNEDGTVLQSSEVEYGETPAYTGETPTKAATAQYTYTFAGWTPEITAVTGDATYTAAFESNIRSYNVTFTVNGETYAERTFEVGAAVIAPEYTVPEGYTFSGWQVPEAMPAEDVTLDATLTINTYTVSFVDGITGEVIAEVTVEHGADAEAPEAPAHICYLFTGWEGEYTGVKCDVTVTACYKLLGDIDGDGVTTAADALMIMRYSIEVIDEIDTSMADVNGDGKVDLVDALIVLRHAMGLV